MNAFLRSWRADDADALAEVYASADADLTGNIPDDRSLDGARAWIEQIHRAETAGTASAYVLVAEPERRIVGNVMASGSNVGTRARGPPTGSSPPHGAPD